MGLSTIELLIVAAWFSPIKYTHVPLPHAGPPTQAPALHGLWAYALNNKQTLLAYSIIISQNQ